MRLKKVEKRQLSSAKAAQRKQDRKDEVVRQKAGAIAATPVEVRGRLLHDARVAGARDDELLAWVIATAQPNATDGNATTASRRDAFRDGGVGHVASRKDVCEAWWRTGFCELKRCRLVSQRSTQRRNVCASSCRRLASEAPTSDAFAPPPLRS